MKVITRENLASLVLTCLLIIPNLYTSIAEAQESFATYHVAKALTGGQEIPPQPGTPDAPTFVTVPATDSDGSYTVTWSIPRGDHNLNVGFTVQESKDSGAYTTLGITGNKYMAVSGRSAGTYKYRVKACTDDWPPKCSAYGNSGNVIVNTATPPTISNIANVTIDEDNNTGDIAFTIADADTSTSSLTLSAISSNTTLVPNGNIVFSGLLGGSRAVKVTPSANQNGTTTITVTVSDGSLTASDTFIVTVNAINDKPTISSIANKTINEDSSTGAMSFTIGDLETGTGSLTLTASTNNATLVPLNKIVFGGSGASRTVTVTPAANLNGSATITARVSDGSLTAYRKFTITVTAVNDAPTISNISNKTINEDSNTGNIEFTIGDLETATTSLILSKASSNTTLVPTGNIVFGGSAANRTVKVTPAANQSGSATITVTVSDGSLTKSDTFVVTVNAVNDAPTISNISNQTITENNDTGNIAFTVGDLETSAASLTLSRASSNSALVSASNIIFGGSGANRTVRVTPAANQIGSATVTVTVSDGALTSSENFLVTVQRGVPDTPPSPHVEPLPAVDTVSDAIGAIAGEFRVDEGGQANYNIPILTPIGSGGVSPSVSLNYNSGGGDGIVGMGWSLNATSAISRCRRTFEQDGVDSDVSLSYSDVFCLDGQRLVIISSGNYGSNGAEYRTSIDSQTRVFSYGTQGSGPSYFEVWRKDGTKSTYGTSNNSDAELVANNNGTLLTTVLTWFQSEVRDSSSNGNAITYSYDINASEGEAVLESISYFPEISISFNYLQRSKIIRGYFQGGNTTLSQQLNNIVVTDNNVILRTYTPNYETDHANRARIKSISESANGVELPETIFGWINSTPSISSSVLKSFSHPRTHESGKPADINGDGKTDLFFIHEAMQDGHDYFSIYLSDGTDLINYTNDTCPNKPATRAYYSAARTWQPLDYNADGKSDIIFVKDGTWQVLLVDDNGTCFVDSLIDTGIEDTELTRIALTDVNADGLIDMVYTDSGPGWHRGTRIRLMERSPSAGNPFRFSTTESYATFTTPSTPPPSGGKDLAMFVTGSSIGDLNGDGKADVIAIMKHCGEQPFICTPVSLIAFASDGNGHFQEYASLDYFSNDAASWSKIDPQIIDINSDGLGDIVFKKPTGSDSRWYYKINTGAGLLPSVLISQIQAGSSFGDANDDSGKVITPVDWDMDGYLDLAYIHNDRVRVVKWHEETATYSNSITTSITPSDDTSAFYPVDFNGNGSQDLLEVDLFVNKKYKVHRQTSARYVADKINKIDNGMGNITDIVYGSMSLTPGLYTRGTGGEDLLFGNESAIFDINSSMSLVKSASSTSPGYSYNGKAFVTYRYGEARAQAGGRGSLGFKWLETTDLQTFIISRTTYRQDYPYVGMPEETRQTSQGNLLSLSKNTYLAKSLYAGSVVFPYVANSTEESWDLDTPSVKLKKIVTQFGNGNGENDYDNYGNPLRITTSTYDGDGSLIASQVVDNDYDNIINGTQWYLGRLTNSTVTHKATGLPSIVRTSDFEYDVNSGFLNKEIVAKSEGANKELSTVYKRDSRGNITQKSICSNHVTNCGENITQDSNEPLFINRISYSIYDDEGRYVDKTKNVFNQIMSEVLSRNQYGQPTSVKDVNGMIVDSVYNSFGEAFFSRSSTGSWSKTTKVQCDGSVSCPGAAVIRVKYESNGEGYSYTYLDALGRKLKVSNRNFADDGFNSIDYHFNNQGLNYRVSEPYADSSGGGIGSKLGITYFDKLGRETRINNADNTGSSIDYQGLTTVYTNELLQTRTEVKNALGHAETITDHLNGVLSYDYDAAGNLTTLSFNNALQSSMAYDNLGRKISMKDWDKGGQIGTGLSWIYSYNALGELVTQTDPKGQITTTFRDELGRTVKQNINVSGLLKESTQWVFNNTVSSIGSASHLVEEKFITTTNSSNYSKTFGYDNLGRSSWVATEIDSHYYLQQTTYDQFGRVFQSFDASGGNKGMRNLYNSVGYIYQVREAASGTSGRLYKEIVSMDERGNVTEEKNGSGLKTIRTYTPDRGFLDAITTSKLDNTGVIQNIQHHFNAVGNLDHKANLISGVIEDYTYDDLNRLQTINNETVVTYDAGGNITWKRDVGSYAYNRKESGCSYIAGRHAVSSAGSERYCYDQNGNQTSGGGRTIAYSPFDKVTQIIKNGHTTQFEYDVNHNRFKRTDTKGGTTTTYYLGNVEIIQSPSGTEVRRNLGNTIVSIKDGVSSIQNIYTDHIGSTDVITDGNGVEKQRFTFDPWGKRTSGEVISPMGNALTLRGFTGHESVEEVDVIHMNGRIYDPTLGRFLQSDPFIQSPKNTQSLNRYSYVLNNPLTLTDPSGYFSMSRWWRRNGQDARVVIAIVINVVACYGGCNFLTAVAAGAASGAVATGTVKGALIGAFSAGVFYGIGSAFENCTSCYSNGTMTAGATAGKILAHATAGGVMSQLQGGKFGHGFAAAGVTQAFSGQIDGINRGARFSPLRVFSAAILGGTTSVISGGKFANGAITAAFSRGFNDELHSQNGKIRTDWGKSAKLVGARMAGGLIVGAESIAEDLGFKEPLADEVDGMLKENFGITIEKETLNRASGTLKIYAGASGIGTGAMVLGSSSTLGLGAVFLSSYGLTRGVDIYFNYAITRTVSGWMCSLDPSCL